MKKLALTSLLAVFAVSGAHAANVIDGNPLYMPKAGHFYSVTSLSSHTDGTPYILGEEFGYGITDRFAVDVKTSLNENKAFDEYAWDDLSLNAAFRAIDMGGWKFDLVGAYSAEGMYNHPAPHGEDAWFDKDSMYYAWTAGVRGGYVAGSWTVAGHALYNYFNSESFNWKDHGMHIWQLGLDAQYVIDSHWSVLAGVEYTGVSNDHYYLDGEDGGKVKNAGEWNGTLGANYNIDATKYVGVYVNGDLNHQGGDNHNKWVAEKGFGFGAKFGIDF